MTISVTAQADDQHTEVETDEEGDFVLTAREREDAPYVVLVDASGVDLTCLVGTILAAGRGPFKVSGRTDTRQAVVGEFKHLAWNCKCGCEGGSAAVD